MENLYLSNRWRIGTFAKRENVFRLLQSEAKYESAIELMTESRPIVATS